MNHLNLSFLCLLILLSSLGVSAQENSNSVLPFGSLTVTQEKIDTKIPENALATADEIRIDENGNFFLSAATQVHPCYFISSQHGKVVLDTMERGGNNLFDGMVLHTPNREAYYFKNFYGTQVFGPFKKQLVGRYSNRNADVIAYTLASKDSLFQYINDSLVNTQAKGEALTPSGAYREWFVVNAAGELAYFLRRENKDYLYLNHQLVEWAYEIAGLNMYDDGTCTWTTRQKPGDREVDFRSNQGVNMSIVPMGENQLLLEDTVYSLMDCPAFLRGTQYMEVSGEHGYENFEENIVVAEREISPANGNHYFAQCPFRDEEGLTAWFTHIDGIKGSETFHRILMPTFDQKGNYSYWGWRKNTAFTVTNGQVTQLPDVSGQIKGNTRTPIYLSPEGTIRWEYAYKPAPQEYGKPRWSAPDTVQLLRNGQVVLETVGKEQQPQLMQVNQYAWAYDTEVPNAQQAIHLRMYKDSYVLQEGILYGPFPTPNFKNEAYFETLSKKEQKAYNELPYKQNHTASYPILDRYGWADGSYFFIQDLGDQVRIVFNNHQTFLPKAEGLLLPNTWRRKGEDLTFLVRNGATISRLKCSVE